METPWNNALLRQFDAAIDTFEEALVTCPDSLWTQRLWPVPPDRLRTTGVRRVLVRRVSYALLVRLVPLRLPGGGLRAPRSLYLG